jgi:hypothetical protein
MLAAKLPKGSWWAGAAVWDDEIESVMALALGMGRASGR